MNSKTTAVALVGLFVLGALVAIPTSSAQAVPKPSLVINDISSPNAPVAPLVQSNIDIDWTYSFNNQAQSVGGVQGSVTLTFDVRCDNSGVTVSGARTYVFNVDVAPGAQSFTEEGTQRFQLTVNREVRALDSIKCSVDASGTAVGNGIPAPDDFGSEFSFQADYFGLIEAKTDVKLQQGGPQKQIPFNIEVTNFGNGQTKISFEVLEKPDGKWQGLVPDQLLLDENGGNRQSATSVFTVVTPFKNGWNNEEGAFTIKLSPEFTVNPEKKGSDVVVNLVARVRGVYVPSLEPMIMVGAVIGSALIARVLKDDE